MLQSLPPVALVLQLSVLQVRLRLVKLPPPPFRLVDASNLNYSPSLAIDASGMRHRPG
jgi:hypothetical protein